MGTEGNGEHSLVSIEGGGVGYCSAPGTGTNESVRQYEGSVRRSSTRVCSCSVRTFGRGQSHGSRTYFGVVLFSVWNDPE